MWCVLTLTLAAAVFATATGVAFLAADHTIRGGSMAFGGRVVHRRRGRHSWFCAIPAYSFASWSKDALAFPARRQKDDRREIKNSQIELGDVLEAIGQVASIVLVLWDYVCAQRWIRATLLFGVRPIIWICHASRDPACGKRSTIFNFGIVIALKLYPMPPDSLTKVVCYAHCFRTDDRRSSCYRETSHGQATERTTGFLNSLIENNPLVIVVTIEKAACNLQRSIRNLSLQPRRDCRSYPDPLISQLHIAEAMH